VTGAIKIKEKTHEITLGCYAGQHEWLFNLHVTLLYTTLDDDYNFQKKKENN
jgi:hypothetical protein